MSDVKEPSLAAMPIETPDSNSTCTKNATTLEAPVRSDTETKSPLWRRVLSFVWDSADGDPEYRRYVQRLDLFLLYVYHLTGEMRLAVQRTDSNARLQPYCDSRLLHQVSLLRVKGHLFQLSRLLHKIPRPNKLQ
jgi:hypothetical protein